MDEDKKEVQKRIAIYLRVSTDDQVEKFGLESQRESIEGAIRSKGKLKDGRDAYILAGPSYIYIDEGISGETEPRARPEFGRLMEDIGDTDANPPPFDLVAVFKIDRFARRLRILLNILQFFEEKKIEFMSATESLDTSTPFGRAMLGIIGVIAELELETIKERTSKGREQALKEGIFMGANTPYGYQKDENKHLIICLEEKEIIEQIFTLFVIENRSCQQIADILTKDEVYTPGASAINNKKRKGDSRRKNGPYFWRADAIRSILADEIYIGVRYIKKSKGGKKLPREEWEKCSFVHDAILSTGIFQLAQKRLENLTNKKEMNKKKEQGHTYLLSGLLQCEHCRSLNEPSHGRTTWVGDKKLRKDVVDTYSYYYRCGRKNSKKYAHTCSVVPIPAVELEEYVVSFIKNLLQNPMTLFEYQKQLRSNVRAKENLEQMKKHFTGLLNNLPMRKENLKGQQENGIIPMVELVEKIKVLNGKETYYKTRIGELDERLTQEALSIGYEKSFEKYAEKYNKVFNETIVDRQELYNLIHALIGEIVVYSRPRTEKDIIAGKKAKELQFIPNQIDITLNLPQHLLRILYEDRFGVKPNTL